MAQAIALNVWALSQMEDAYFEQGQARPTLEARQQQLDSGQLDAEIAATAPGALAAVMQETENG